MKKFKLTGGWIVLAFWVVAILLIFVVKALLN
jgi:hypothetical protein